MVDVRIKLLLQGGHFWDFSCDEDDPIVLGLVSALPGASVDPKLPSDGIVQVATRGGKRLFLTRSSLVSVEIDRSLSHPLNFDDSRRLVGPSSIVPGGMSGPSAFVLASDALPAHIHRALLDSAISQCATSAAGTLELQLGALTQQVASALRSKIEKSRVAFGAHGGPPDAHTRFRLFAVGDAQEISLSKDAHDVLHLIYHFYRKPKTFTGGGIRVFDVQTGDASQRLTFRDIEIEDNEVLILPAHVVNTRLPVHGDKPSMTDGLFALHGVVHRIAK